MIKDNLIVMDGLTQYASPKARLTRILKSGELVQIRRGLYLDPKEDYSTKTLANMIYGPSYISFEYALAYYGLIPEKVNAYTSAAYRKNKNKTFHTPLGSFLYYYLPKEVYPYGITKEQENNDSFLIATPEKALCDMLYKVKRLDIKNPMESLLFDDLRMDENAIKNLDKKELSFLVTLYKKKIHYKFLKWFNGD